MASGLVYFIITMIGAAIFVKLLNRFGSKTLRARIDERANTQIEDLDNAITIASAGTKTAPQQRGNTRIFKVSSGVRLLSTMLTAGVMAWLIGSPQFLVAERDTPLLIAGAGLLSIWYLLRIWTYSLHIDEETISVPTWFFRRRKYALADLESFEDDGAYNFRLFFTGHRVATVLKQLRGLSDLTQTLQDHARLKVS